MSTNPSGRDAAQRRSAVPLTYLRQLPPSILPVLTAVLLVAGLAFKGPGGAAVLVVLVAFLGWLAYLSWPRVGPAGRLLRVIIIAGGVALAVWQALR
jgi:hypothetical protein